MKKFVILALACAGPASAQVAPSPAFRLCDALIDAVAAARSGSMTRLAPRGAFGAAAFGEPVLPLADCATPVDGYETCTVVVTPDYESWSVQTVVPIQGAQPRLDEILDDVAVCLDTAGDWRPSEALSPPNVQVEVNVVDVPERAHVAVRAAQISEDEALIVVLAAPVAKLLRDFGGGPAGAEELGLTEPSIGRES